jgi:hypothetical protein
MFFTSYDFLPLYDAVGKTLLEDVKLYGKNDIKEV